MKRTFLLILAAFLLVGGFTSSAHAATGTIDTTSRYSQFLDYDGNNDSVFDRINWKTTNGTPVTVSDTELTGYIWGETVGWINLNPKNGGVTNTTGGILGGYAWGENTGWINFAPTNGGVTIDTTTGEFSGDAWSQNYGWITFSCPGANTCVITDWRPDGGNNGSSGSGGQVNGTNPVAPVYAACADGVDNDQDGLVDMNDSGCSSVSDNSEYNLPPDLSPAPDPETSSTPGDVTPVPGDAPLNPLPGRPNGGPGANPDGGPSSPETPAVMPSVIDDIVNALEVPLAAVRQWVQPGGGVGSRAPHLAWLESFVNGTVAQIPVFNDISSWILSTPLPLVLQVIGLVGIALTAPSVFMRVLNALLGFLGYKKRRRPWGVVYDAVTKQPLDPAYVTLLDASGKEVASAITDIDGRYSFLVAPGTYTLSAGKTHYTFPSKILFGRDRDELYSNLYFGQPFTINKEGEVIIENIPMDPEGVDWNEQAKREMTVFSFFSQRDRKLVKLFNVLFIIGLVASIFMTLVSPVLYNFIILAVYVVILIFEAIGYVPATTGHLARLGKPLAHAIVRVWTSDQTREVAHRVADERGRYYLLVHKGDYVITIDARNPDGSYERVMTSQVLKARKGVINKSFEL